jgi:hypothetical protein
MDLSLYYSGYGSGISDIFGPYSYLIWPMIIFLLMLALLAVILYRNQSPGITDYMPDMVSLTKTNYPIGSNQAYNLLLAGPGSTLAGLFNVSIGDRTNQTASATTTNYTTLFGVLGSMEFQLAPANLSTTDSTSRLLISTQSGATETISLPPLPAQKWVFIAILRDGRRYDVLYNDKIVASHRLDAYPNTAVQNQLQVGLSPASSSAPSRFLGNAIHLIALNYRMHPKDLAILRSTYVDTTGAPPIPLPFPFPTSLPSLQTLCIPGVPCDPVTKPPPNHLQAWSSPYA